MDSQFRGHSGRVVWVVYRGIFGKQDLWQCALLDATRTRITGGVTKLTLWRRCPCPSWGVGRCCSACLLINSNHSKVLFMGLVSTFCQVLYRYDNGHFMMIKTISLLLNWEDNSFPGPPSTVSSVFVVSARSLQPDCSVYGLLLTDGGFVWIFIQEKVNKSR